MKKLFHNVPSVLEQAVCANPLCKIHTTLIPALPVNHNVITKNSFNALEKALDFHDKLYNMPCKYCQIGKQTIHYTPKECMYIELDISCSNEKACGRTCKLSEFPANLNLKV